MKTILALLFFTSYAFAQAPTKAIRRDSLPKFFPPDVNLPSVDSPSVDSPDLMPNARPNNSFYRSPTDPKNVVRATLDNMPIKVPDTSVTYIIGRPYPWHRRLTEPPMPFFEPLPRIVPKKFR